MKSEFDAKDDTMRGTGFAVWLIGLLSWGLECGTGGPSR